MKVGAEDKRKQTIAIVLFVVAAGLVGYNLLSGPSSTPPPPAPPVILTAGGTKTASGPAASKVVATSAQLDPTLHMGPMLTTENLVYTGTGRNIFSGEMEAPPAPPIPVPGYTARATTPQPPTPPPPPQKQGPPPVNLKFFGTSTDIRNGTRKAFLLNGDDVFVASVGDVVNRRYRVVSIAANSVLIEDIPNTNKQTLPLVGN
jgi:hypothetical protein